MKNFHDSIGRWLAHVPKLSNSMTTSRYSFTAESADKSIDTITNIATFVLFATIETKQLKLIKILRNIQIMGR